MAPQRVRKHIVCPECGRVLKVVPVPTAVVEQEVLPDDETPNGMAALPANGLPGEEVEIIIEEGPVCPRCAGS